MTADEILRVLSDMGEAGWLGEATVVSVKPAEFKFGKDATCITIEIPDEILRRWTTVEVRLD